MRCSTEHQAVAGRGHVSGVAEVDVETWSFGLASRLIISNCIGHQRQLPEVPVDDLARKLDCLR
jgi:hypothetical protein